VHTLNEVSTAALPAVAGAIELARVVGNGALADPDAYPAGATLDGAGLTSCVELVPL
jgi:hypothetical protein